MTVTAGPNPEGKVDVLVAGSGAAGLVAALAAASVGARVRLIESADAIGGTTALSGGRVWVPCNGHDANAGDTPKAARQYLTGLFDDDFGHLIDTFLASAPEMAAFVGQHAPHHFIACPYYPDYHPGRPGATAGGRCLDAMPLDTNGLSPLLRLVRRPPGYTPVTQAEWEQWRYPPLFDHDLIAVRRATGIDTGGVALVSALLHAVAACGVGISVGARLTHIAGSGADWRATVCSRGRAEPVDCRAVILATGGYDYDADRRRRWLPGPITALGSVPENVGDGLTIAERLGARIRNLHAGWWMPMIKVPGELVGGQPYSRGLVRERGAPRQIIVDDRGERFVDEASPYHEFVTAMIRRDESGDYPHGRAYMVFDSVFHQRYPLPGMVGQAVPPPWVGSAPDLIGLGRAIGVDGAALMASVRRWNDMCAGGADSDFGRGESTYDKYFGDPVVTPNPAMGPIEVPPFYAVQVHAGCIGTKGGPETDMDGQLLDMGGEPIPGVYAAGNASAFWTADGYPGPGATLAAAMTFGYRAGKHAVAA